MTNKGDSVQFGLGTICANFCFKNCKQVLWTDDRKVNRYQH